MVGPSGGELAWEADGYGVRVRFAPAAVEADREVMLDPPKRRPGALAPVVALGPSGEFEADVTVCLRYPGESVPWVVVDELRVAHASASASSASAPRWEMLARATGESGEVCGVTRSFSLFTIVPAAPNEGGAIGHGVGTSFTAGTFHLEASAPIEMLSLAVAPMRVDLVVRSAGTSLVTLTLSGLRPSSVVHLYDGSFLRGQALNTDASGVTTTSLDLAGGKHTLWLQALPSTRFVSLPDGGDCTTSLGGTWDGSACSLGGDVDPDGSIEVGSGASLDCAGHRIVIDRVVPTVLVPAGAHGVGVRRCVIETALVGIQVADDATDTVIESNEIVPPSGFIPADPDDPVVCRPSGFGIACGPVGIYLLGAGAGGVVRGNISAYPIALRHTPGTLVEGNALAAEIDTPLYLYGLGSDGNTVRGHLLTAFAASGEFRPTIAIDTDALDNIVEDNSVTGSGTAVGFGIIDRALGTRARRNRFESLDVGVYTDTSEIEITRNVFAANIFAVGFGAGDARRRVFLNDFVGNGPPQLFADGEVALFDDDASSPTFQKGNHWGHGCPGPLFLPEDVLSGDATPLDDPYAFRSPVAAVPDAELPLPGCAVAEDLDDDGFMSAARGGDDCDDLDPAAYPGAPEWCDGVDNDCDAQVDDAACEPASFTPVIPDAPIPATHRTFFPRVVVARGESVLIDVPATAVEPTLYVSTTDHRGLGPHPFLLNGVDPLPPLPGPPPSPSSKAIFLPLPAGTSLIEMTGPRDAVLVEGVDRSYRCLLLEQEFERGKGAASTQLVALAVHESGSALSVTAERDLAAGPGSLHALLETEATGGTAGTGGAGGAGGAAGGGIPLCSELELGGLESGLYGDCAPIPPPPPPPSELSPAVTGTATVKLAGAPGGTYTLAVESLDAAAPQGTLAVQSGLVTCEQEIEIAGDADGDTASVTVDGLAATITRAQGLVHYSARVSLSFGVNQVEVCLTDVCENRSCANVSVLVGREERCDGVDNDCDLEIDEDFDSDGDGSSLCGSDPDCDDTRADVHPGALERCDGVDNDCDTQSDEGLSVDADGDGHFTPGSCAQPADDCDDGSSECDADCGDADGNFIPDCRDHTKAWDYGASTTWLRTFALTTELDAAVRGFLVQTPSAVSLNVAAPEDGVSVSQVGVRFSHLAPHETWVVQLSGSSNEIAIQADATGDLDVELPVPGSMVLQKEPSTLRITSLADCPGGFVAGPGRPRCLVVGVVGTIEIALDSVRLVCLQLSPTVVQAGAHSRAGIVVEGDDVAVENCEVHGGLAGIEVADGADHVELIQNRIVAGVDQQGRPSPAIGIKVTNASDVLLRDNEVPAASSTCVTLPVPGETCRVPMLFGVQSFASEVEIRDSVFDRLGPVVLAYATNGSYLGTRVFYPDVGCAISPLDAALGIAISITPPVAVFAGGGEVTLNGNAISNVWGRAEPTFGQLVPVGEECFAFVAGRGTAIHIDGPQRFDMSRNTLENIGGLSLHVLGPTTNVSIVENNFTGHVDDALIVRSQELLEMSAEVGADMHGNYWDRSAPPLFVPGVMAQHAIDRHPFCTRDGWLTAETPCECAGPDGCLAEAALTVTSGINFGDLRSGLVSPVGLVDVASIGPRDPILLGFFAASGPDEHFDVFSPPVPFAIDAPSTSCQVGNVIDAACQIGVRFMPQALGPQQAVVRVESDSFASPQVVSLSGFASAAATPAVEPLFVRLGPTLRGSISPRQPVTLRNAGTDTLSVTSVSVSPSLFRLANHCFESELAWEGFGESCTVEVWIAPAATASYPYLSAGTLVINTNAGSVTVALEALVDPCVPSGTPVGTEQCDGIDNDCDGAVDDGLDRDGDGYTPCGTDGHGMLADCDDFDDAIHPGAIEVCDQVDNDCDGDVNESGPGTAGFNDCDGDLSLGPDAGVWDSFQDVFGGTAQGYYEAFRDAGLADCDDTDHTIYPGAPLRCNHNDHNDCMRRCDLNPGADCSGESAAFLCAADVVHSLCVEDDLQDCVPVARELVFPDPTIDLSPQDLSAEIYPDFPSSQQPRSMLVVCREPVAMTAFSDVLLGSVWSASCYPEVAGQQGVAELPLVLVLPGGRVRISSLDFIERTITQLRNGNMGFDAGNISVLNDAPSIGINLEGVEDILRDTALRAVSEIPSEFDPEVTADVVRVYAAPWAWFWTHADGSVPGATPGIDLSHGMFVVGVGDGTISVPGVFGDRGLGGETNDNVPFYQGLEVTDAINTFAPQWFDRDHEVIVAEVQISVTVTIPAVGPLQPLIVRLHFFLHPEVDFFDPVTGNDNSDPPGDRVPSGFPEIEVWGYILWLGLANGNFDPVLVQPVLGAIRGAIDGRRDQIPDPECAVDTDCAAGRTCVRGECLPRTDPCAIDAQCGGGEVCAETSFELMGAPCVLDATCPAEFPECRSGFCGRARRGCVRLAARCRTPDTLTAIYECAAGDVCPDFLCVPPGTAPPCNLGEAEYQGACYPSVGGCTTHLNCPPGNACVVAEAVVSSCSTSADCPAGSECEQTRCVIEQPECLPSSVRCISDADCEDGRCLGGLCLAEGSAGCAVESDCAPWQVCVTGSCVEGSRACQPDILEGLYDCGWPDEYCSDGLCLARGGVCGDFQDDLFPTLDTPSYTAYIRDGMEGQCGYGRDCLEARCVSPCIARHGEDASPLVIAACQVGDSVRDGLDTLHRDSIPLLPTIQLEFFTHWAIAVPAADGEDFREIAPILELGVCPMVGESIGITPGCEFLE